MTYDIYISEKAEQDLDEIYHYYLQEFSEMSAKKVMVSIKNAISILELSPDGYVDFDSRIGRQIFPNGKVRMIPGKHHLVFYLVRDLRVDVLRVRGAKTDYLNELDNLFKNIIE